MKKIICVLLSLTLCFSLVGCDSKKKSEPSNNVDGNNGNDAKPVVKTLQIVDEESNTRPIAVMINNHPSARPYQSGLQDAYLVYELLVEGGITRMMAVFKDQNTSRIGPVRSARHTYLDYSFENDAVYTHFGWSNIAESDISSMNVANINGLYSGAFWRDKTLNVAYEHTAFTSMELLSNEIKRYKYRTTTEKELLLNYSIEDINLKEEENSSITNNISIKFSTSNTTSYTYDTTSKKYKRFVNDVINKDYVTGKQYDFKNLILVKINNYTLDSAGHQEFDNIGTGTGYYITNGYSIPITWSKSGRKEQTVYKDCSYERLCNIFCLIYVICYN